MSLTRYLRCKTLSRLDGVTLVPKCHHSTNSRPAWLSTLHAPVQSYVSDSTSPQLNLSIEHHLLERSPPDSTVLFLYTNRPSIVIGRNQNPWLEANLALLHRTNASSQAQHEPLELVRRRSGGGTVFHDLGNINWTVICPAQQFTRAKHAEMVVRALRSPMCRVERARVNERHDIVMDQGPPPPADIRAAHNPNNLYRTPWTDERSPTPLKVTGSAYKLTRQRALHHGTLLLDSDLAALSRFLRSPARGHITARGVDSVRSPVGNLGVTRAHVIQAVREEFHRMYGSSGQQIQHLEIHEDEALADSNVSSGMEELSSLQWTFGQTPGFEFTSQSSNMQSRLWGPHFWFKARQGQVEEAGWLREEEQKKEGIPAKDQWQSLVGKKLYGNMTWLDVLPTRGWADTNSRAQAAGWMQETIPLVSK